MSMFLRNDNAGVSGIELKAWERNAALCGQQAAHKDR